jgi:uncharacterized protein (TIGR02680 family)
MSDIAAASERFRLSRAGVLNVWQYDEQVFEFADGRLLLRGSNGAGKSKTLEMLLPFVLDGDKARMTASGRHHTSLLWLMLDGYAGQNRAGYLWVEFAGGEEIITCGVGIRASQSARTASAWYFTVPGRVGERLSLEDEAGPLARERLRAAVESADGHFFDSPRAYKQHVGRLLFGLEPGQYDELLRLLYWLRQPQVGEDIEPARLAEQLVQALPQLDDDAVRAAGDTFDELAAFGEQLDRQRRSAEGVAAFAAVYADYAREVVRGRGAEVGEQHSERTRRSGELARRQAAVAALAAEQEAAEGEREDIAGDLAALVARLGELRADPLLRTERELANRREVAAERVRAAGSAGEVARRARGRAEQSGARLRRDAASLRTDLARYAGAARTHAADLARVGAGVALPVAAALHEPVLDRADDVARALDALGEHEPAVRGARRALGELRAAVEVVQVARAALDTAVGERGRAEESAAQAEQRAEAERGRRADAQRSADQAEAGFRAGFDRWRADPHAVPFQADDQLTAEAVLALPTSARAAAEPVLRGHRDREKVAGAARTAAARAFDEVRARRDAVAAERDPSPPEPAWFRDARDDGDGAPLWRLVDFADALDRAGRAGLEAALEASGLLDAWVRADGAVLAADRRDVVLPAGPAVAGASLADLLIADPPPHAPVTADVVRGVLARVGLSPTVAGEAASRGDLGSGHPWARDELELAAVVAADGTWRLGPATGRAAKPVAQYVGATARAEERARRLAELDEQWAIHAAAREAAAEAEQAARAAAEAVEVWLGDVPPGGGLVAAWARLDERVRISDSAERAAAAAEATAVRAREVEAGRRRELDELAAIHGLPTESEPLAARRETLRDLDQALAAHVERVAVVSAGLRRWAEDAEAGERDVAESDESAALAHRARTRAEAAQAAADELEQSIGAPLREIRARIEAAEERERLLQHRDGELARRIAELLGEGGAARQAAADAVQRLAEHEPVLADAVAAVAAMAETPGLLASGTPAPPEPVAELGSAVTERAAGPAERDALDPDDPDGHDPDDPDPDATDRDRADGPAERTTGFAPAATLDLARGYRSGQPVPAAVLTLARRLADLPAPSRAGTEMAVYAAWQDATSGPAGDVDPRVAEAGGALAVIGRDDAGEHPIGTLAGRLAAAVARDAELLTERERRLFEEHILGDLGESLRARRIEADELVTEMNQLLRGVTTSQGIEVQLRWRLRDDVAADARRAVELLGNPVGSLLPDERRELRDALHRLIEASRADAPEDSYAEHLARALDYRRWFAFRIRYTRPENAGTWHDLHRRSPLSQGEQKVVCYLPLFAAAAAHFSSLAGAAPHSPRFVLLDDAFPKIDVRTHPLLFGLLVQLDLDFVVTSERLWGDHATVPSLAIYEALRDPNERGIAQYRHHWDGQRLQAVAR